MKIAEAIRIKKEEIAKPFSHSLAAIDKADNMSIEALKRIEECRPFLFALRHPLLPGETEE